MPTLKGWILIISVSILAIYWITKNLHEFLAENRPIQGEVLVVEGWIPDFAINPLIEYFYANDYKYLITVGSPIYKGSYLTNYKTSSERLASGLVAMGIKSSKIKVINTHAVKKDRTYASAKAFSAWCLNSDSVVQSVDIYTLGAHARRSRLLYDQALKNQVLVGVVSANDINYNPEKWWQTSLGFRTVINEAIAYLYLGIVNLSPV